MRVMGLDYGTKTVGVAISDPLGLTAQGIETIQRKEENKLRRTCARIEELIKEYQVEKIVLGFPKHMNNDIGERAQKSLEFRDMLVRRTGLEVIMWDERLTTVAAEQTLIESGVRRENRKQYAENSRIEENHMEKAKFTFSDGSGADEFFVLEETKINGSAYILVVDSEEDDAECLILREVEESKDAEKTYEIVEDDTELMAVSKVFEELLEDVDIEM